MSCCGNKSGAAAANEIFKRWWCASGSSKPRGFYNDNDHHETSSSLLAPPHHHHRPLPRSSVVRFFSDDGRAANDRSRTGTPAETSSSSSSSEPESDERVSTTRLENGVVHVQLSRPSKLNSLDVPMFEAIAETAATLKRDASVRAVVLSGKGKAFCAGLDMVSSSVRLFVRRTRFAPERGSVAFPTSDVLTKERCNRLSPHAS